MKGSKVHQVPSSSIGFTSSHSPVTLPSSAERLHGPWAAQACQALEQVSSYLW